MPLIVSDPTIFRGRWSDVLANDVPSPETDLLAIFVLLMFASKIGTESPIAALGADRFVNDVVVSQARNATSSALISSARVQGQAVEEGLLTSMNFTSFDYLCLTPGCCLRRQNTVVIALDDHRRHIIARNVLAEVFDPSVDAGQSPDWRRADRDRQLASMTRSLTMLSVSPTDTVEVLQELHQWRSAGPPLSRRIPSNALGSAALWIVGRLHQVRSKRARSARLYGAAWCRICRCMPV